MPCETIGDLALDLKQEANDVHWTLSVMQLAIAWKLRPLVLDRTDPVPSSLACGGRHPHPVRVGGFIRGIVHRVLLDKWRLLRSAHRCRAQHACTGHQLGATLDRLIDELHKG